MAAVIFTKLSGWLLLPLLITTTSLPFILRRKSLLLSLGEVGAQMRPYLQRLRPHYVLGYAITGLVVAHAWVPMSAGFGGHANTLGLYLGTAALFALIGQVFLGRLLHDPAVSNRRILRRTHLWVMISIVLLACGHILLDSSTLHLVSP